MAERQTLFRRWCFNLHSFVGMVLGLYLFLMALSGSALVFYDEWQASLMPKLVNTDQAKQEWISLGRLIENSEAAFDKYKVSWIKLSPQKGPILVYARRGSDRITLLLNPSTGKVIGRLGRFIEAVRFFHFDLFRADFGRKLQGAGAMVFLFMAFTGLGLWLFMSSKGKPFNQLKNFDGGVVSFKALHTTGGILLLPMIVIWSVSALYFAYPNIVKGFLTRTLNDSSSSEVRLLENKAYNLDDISQFVDSLRAGEVERPLWLKVSDVNREYQVLSKSIDGKGDSISYQFDLEKGSVKRRINSSAHSPTGQVVAWLKHLHFGDFFGFPIKVLWALFGLGTAGLFCSGIYLKLARKRRA